MIRGVIAAVVVLLASVPVEAANYTAQELQEDCSDRSTSSLRGLLCLRYIAGFVAGIRANEGTEKKVERIWCFPEGANVGQARLIIEKYMRDNPQLLHLDAASAAGLALMSAFPCK